MNRVKATLYLSACLVSLSLLACSVPRDRNSTEQEVQADSLEAAGPTGETSYPYTFKAEGNPFVTHIRTADPDVNVWPDGKLWMYTSQDFLPHPDSAFYSAMDGYHAFSTEDLVNWTDHGEVLHSRNVPWGREGWMWAPGAAYKNGKYYLYYSHLDDEGIFRTGVAVSEKPEGPFLDTGDYIKGTQGIDPRCFVDDDGTAYLYFHSKVAKLKPNMIELAEEPRPVDYGAADRAATNEDFIEGPWMFKREGKYYYSYSNFKNEEFQSFYGIGDSPYGPFEWKGAIAPKPPGSQDHHSILEFRGDWYYFYHTGNYTDAQGNPGKANQRTTCVDRLYFNKDGTIKPVQHSEEGIW